VERAEGSASGRSDGPEGEEEVHDPPDLLEALGGGHGIADSGLPAIAFVAAYTLGGNDLTVAAWIAVGIAGLLTVVRLLRRETLQYALAGFAGVALAAFVADRTGRAEDFFLPGLLLNAGYASAYLISILVRWPLIGVILETIEGRGRGWRKDPTRVRVYSQASWIWVGVFLTRLAVQLPLYLAGALVALGIAKAAMGLPIFAFAIWLTYLVLRDSGLARLPRPAR
jgi:hypothetical protein